jgi:NAD-dependent deacetylase
MKKKIIVLTGAGISAESGLQTFRGSNGLWNGYNIYEVASPQGWQKDPAMVLDFYNMRRREVAKAKPNLAHKVLVELEKKFEVIIITQNIDNLHEQAGSSHIIHLHGEIIKAQSTTNPELIYNIEFEDIEIGQTCELGSQLRPFIVWFGEAVPMIEKAVHKCADADILIVVGTSLQVYPAAGLIHEVPSVSKKYIIDPEAVHASPFKNIEYIKATATEGLPMLVNQLLHD